MADSAVFRGTGALRIGRALAVAGLVSIFLLILRDRLGSLDLAAVIASLLSVEPLHWLASLCLVAASFRAVAGQEETLHRHFATHAPVGQARRAGMAAVAVGQAVGFGPAVGALIRWRMVPSLGGWQAARLSLGMSLGFLLALATALALACLASPALLPYRTAAYAVLVVNAALICLCAAPPHRLSRRLRLPNLLCLSGFFGWAMLDLLALTAALWVLLPPGVDLAFPVLLPVFLLALGAGLLSGAPGGVGAFELTLLTLLPTVDAAGLIGAVLAFRLTAFVIPGLLGGLAALRRPQPIAATRQDTGLASPPPRAESRLVRQGQVTLHSAPGTASWVLGRVPQSCVALGDPGLAEGPDARRVALAGLARTTRAEGRMPCLYKTGARTALAARRAGWIVRPVAAEAWLRPDRFSLAGPALAGLRRKLRRASQAGVTIEPGTDPLPLPAMADVAAHWARAHGGERGFSMGRWCPDYVAGQRVFLAHHRGRLTAFITLHDSASEWTLDLMRCLPDSPDGTMHALVAAAIDAARRDGIPRLSLAAVPRHRQRKRAPKPDGLARFKAAFAPNWEPLYLCAPSRLAMAVAAADIARAVMRPTPLETARPKDHPDKNEFALRTVPWHRKPARQPGGATGVTRKELS